LCGLESPVVAGLAEHVGEHGHQFGGGVDVTNPAAFVVIPQHDLGDRETDQFTVGECREEGIQLVRHRLILNSLLHIPGHRPRFT
jgi:hypothetical protein